MRSSQFFLAVALLGSAVLVMFDDAIPTRESTEAVKRPSSALASSAGSVEAAAQGATMTTIITPVASVTTTRSGKELAKTIIQRLIPRAALVSETGEASFAAGEAVFQRQSWNPPLHPVAKPSPPPMAPVVPFAVIGKALADDAWEVYLALGDRTYVARPQNLIDGRYRVESIAPPTMSITYLPLNQVQQINIGALE